MSRNCFYHHICHWCGRQANNDLIIKKCSSCRLVAYCCIEHQKYDWIIHKRLCKIIKYLKERSSSLFAFQGKTQKEWNKHRTNIMFSVELVLKGRLEVCERQMILFPNVCQFCYKYNATHNPCRDCFCIFYCSKEHLVKDSVKHSKVCKEFKLCFDIDLYLRDDPFIDLNNFILRKGRVKKCFPSSIDEYIADYLVDNYNKSEKILGSEHLSFVLSLLYGLYKSNIGELFSLTIITIHIIGSNRHEDNMIKFMEIFFDWFPKLKVLKVLMVGPECDDGPLNISPSNEFAGKNVLIINRLKKLYHDYVKDENFVIPEIVVGYNCGFSEYIDSVQDTWKETIQFVLNLEKVLLIITSYTKKEADNDFARIIDNNVNKSELEIIICAERNPFGSLRPVRDWENLSVFYLNHYITVIYTQRK